MRLDEYIVPVPENGGALRLRRRHDGVVVLNQFGRAAHVIPWSWLQRPKTKIEIADEMADRFEAALKGTFDPKLGDLIQAYRDADE